MASALTGRQQAYLDYIRAYIETHESAPGVKEIAGHFGVSSPSAHKALEALQKAGYLYFGRSRSVL